MKFLSWLFGKKGPSCKHDFVDDDQLVVCARNDLNKRYDFQLCRKCGKVEIYHGSGFWQEADTQLVLAKEQWEELQEERQKDAWKDKLARPAYRDTSGKYRSIDDLD